MLLFIQDFQRQSDCFLNVEYRTKLSFTTLRMGGSSFIEEEWEIQSISYGETILPWLAQQIAYLIG